MENIFFNILYLLTVELLRFCKFTIQSYRNISFTLLNHLGKYEKQKY